MDVRYQDKTVKQRIAGMYFPYVLAVSGLRNTGMKTKHDETKRNETQKKSECLVLLRSSVYLCLTFVLLQVIDNLNVISTMDYEEKRITLICFLYVLKNIQADLLTQWWKKETLSRIVAFFDALAKCAETFEVRISCYILECELLLLIIVVVAVCWRREMV